MTTDRRTVAVALTLTTSLFEAVQGGVDPVRRDVRAALSELAVDLGVEAEPIVVVDETEIEDAEQPVRLSVQGIPCPFPRSALVTAAAYVEGAPETATDSQETLNRLRLAASTDPSAFAAILALVARGAVSAQAGVLLAPTGSAGLRGALDLGVSIAPRDEGFDGDGDVEDLVLALAEPTIELLVESDYLRLITAGKGELFPELRETLFLELGLPLPPFHLRRDRSLRAGGFAFRVNAVQTIPRLGLAPGTLLVNDTPEHVTAIVKTEAVPRPIPANDLPGAVVAETHKGALEAEGLTTWDPTEFLILSLAETVRRRAYTLMNLNVARGMVSTLGYAFPALDEAARVHVPLPRLASVLRELLTDRVPIRNLRRILELLVEHETSDAVESDRLTFVRAGLADLIANVAARNTMTVVTYLLDDAIERELSDHATATESAEADSLPERLRSAVRAEISDLPPAAATPAILTRDELRRPLREVLRHEFPRIAILGYSDLPLERNVQPVARITWEQVRVTT